MMGNDELIWKGKLEAGRGKGISILNPRGIGSRLDLCAVRAVPVVDVRSESSAIGSVVELVRTDCVVAST
jgi:hypothetical protein